jgi:hypothetical protein
MKFTRTAKAALAVCAVTAGLVGLSAMPASAAAVLLPVADLGDALGSDPHHVTGSCTPGAGVSTNLNQITYAIAGTATAYSTNGSTPVATGLTCVVRNVSTHHVYGAVSGSLPGPNGAAAGLVTVPTNANVEMCVVENALFSDNGTAHHSTC